MIAPAAPANPRNVPRRMACETPSTLLTRSSGTVTEAPSTAITIPVGATDVTIPSRWNPSVIVTRTVLPTAFWASAFIDAGAGVCARQSGALVPISTAATTAVTMARR
jgi:hypothetical protein